MATMRPKEFPKNPKDYHSEAKTFEAFSKLSQEWTVIYSYRWHGMRKGRIGDGEADFLLLHPRYGFYVAEVKGGSDIKFEDGIYWQKSLGTWKSMTTGPFEQGTITSNQISKHLKKYISQNMSPDLPRFVPNFGHFAVFPSAIEKNGFPPEGPREIIMDSDDLMNVEKRLLEIVHHWNKTNPHKSMTAKNVDAIVNALRPYKELVLSVRNDVKQVEKELVALTNQQAQLLSSIQNIAVIKGAAGTGKTLLALERSKDLAEQGLNTLFLCFNRPLSDYLNKNLPNKPGKLTISTLHSFAKRVCDMAQLSIDIDDFDSLIENFPFAAMSQSVTFDAIIVDEAQDFTTEMWYSLTEFIDSFKKSEDFVLNIFLDSNQNIYEGSGWENAIRKYSSLIEVHNLFVNCRNTTEIGLLVEKFGGGHLFLGTKGPAPTFLQCDQSIDIMDVLEREILRLQKTFEFDSTQIAVLSSTRALSETIEGEFKTKSLKSGAQTSNFEFETIRSFKGLESPCAIVIFSPNELGESEESVEQSEIDRLSYVGFSRAQVVLTIIGSKKTIVKLKAKMLPS